MQKQYARMALVAAVLLGCTGSAFADSLTFTFTTIPGLGGVSGPAGSTVGWGYAITNNSSTGWLLTTGLSADPFLNGIPNAIFDFPILAPSQTLLSAFDPVTNSGLYALTWDPGAPAGFVNSGVFILSGEWFDNDPFAGGNFVQTALDVSAPYSASVFAETGPTPIPEPSTLVLVGGGLAVLILTRARDHKRSRSG